MSTQRVASTDVYTMSKAALVEAVGAKARPLGLQIAKHLLAASTSLELAAGLMALREREEGEASNEIDKTGTPPVCSEKSGNGHQTPVDADPDEAMVLLALRQRPHGTQVPIAEIRRFAAGQGHETGGLDAALARLRKADRIGSPSAGLYYLLAGRD